MEKGRFDSLTGLRGVSCIWVLAYHFVASASSGGLSRLPVARDGYLGVDVFFMLSGFILCHVYADRLRGFRGTPYATFIQARLARVYPLHAVALLLTLALFVASSDLRARYAGKPEQFSVASFIQSALLVQNWTLFHVTSWNVPSWSLSAEWLAYLAFPLFLAVIHRVSGVRLALGLAVSALATLIMLARVAGHDLEPSGPVGMLRMAAEFLCGCLIFRALALGWRPPTGWASALAGVLLAAAMIDRSLNGLALFAFALILAVGARGDGAVARILAGRVPVFLGEISFSIYMLHWLILQVSNVLWIRHAPTSGPGLLAWNLVLLGAILAAAWGSYRFVELPARAFGRRLAAGSRRVATA